MHKFPDFLVKTLSEPRLKTYLRLTQKDRYHRSPETLYALNIIYSKELYPILGGLEITIRNAFDRQLSDKYGENWLDSINLQSTHKMQLDKAKSKLAFREKQKHGDLIAELSFGFWIHLTDAPYEQKVWTSALRHSFPHKFGRPVRKDIEARLKEILKLRNKIAHLEPIIRQEDVLIQAYQSCYDIISWICPETADWFNSKNSFQSTWKNRATFTLEENLK